MAFERYWLFAVICLGIALVLVRLVTRERLTLQASLSFLLLLGAFGCAALFPGLTAWFAKQLGFALPSNFFFAATICGLVALHLFALMSLSRVELRSVALTQELAILEERLSQLDKRVDGEVTEFDRTNARLGPGVS